TGLQSSVGDPKEAGDGIFRVHGDLPAPLYVREQNGWAFFSESSANLGVLPDNPISLLEGLETQHDLAVRYLMKNASARERGEFLQGFNLGVEAAAKTSGSQNVEQIVPMLELLAERLVADTDSFTLGWKVNLDTQRAYCDVNWNFCKDT